MTCSGQLLKPIAGHQPGIYRDGFLEPAKEAAAMLDGNSAGGGDGTTEHLSLPLWGFSPNRHLCGFLRTRGLGLSHQ